MVSTGWRLTKMRGSLGQMQLVARTWKGGLAAAPAAFCTAGPPFSLTTSTRKLAFSPIALSAIAFHRKKKSLPVRVNVALIVVD